MPLAERGTAAWLVLRLLIVGALWLSLVVYAVRIGHDFYTHVDRAVWVTTDDGEAGIAYALANQGRYAFLSSPLLENMPRLHGQFNYGPWYFYLAAGVVWLFGYSLTAVRAIHFWVVIGGVLSAAMWFRGRHRTAAPAVFGFGFLYFFSVIEWPMARPDSLVTAFAIGMIVATGLAVSRRRARYWFLAGLAAACGALTHLIAAALVPAVLVMFGAFAWIERRERGVPESAVTWRAAIALAAGLALGAVMFYASFGFDVALQYRFLLGYRDVTASPDTYVQAIAKHFAAAFGPFAPWFQALVVATLAGAWLLVLATAPRPTHRRIAAASLLPSTIVWTLYLITNGKYTNYHSGYAILHHAMFLWTAAAVLWVLLGMISGRARLAAAAGMLASALVLVAGVRAVASQIAEPPRAAASARLVPFSEYERHVLDAIPARATAWGTILFGMASPDRVQLVQYSDAVTLALQVPQNERRRIAPDYIVWGYPEANETTLQVLHGLPVSAMLWSQLAHVLPGEQFRLASLTFGLPYGTTRVYARAVGQSGDRRLPAVAVYDAPHERWLTRPGAVLPLTLSRIAPLTLHVGYDTRAPASIAANTVVATLPNGAYLLQVSIAPGSGLSDRRLIAVTSPDMITQTIELAPGGDFVPYTAGDRQVFALLFHEGGPLYVSQFDAAAGAGIEKVDAYPVHDLLDPGEHPSRSRQLPDFALWEPAGGVRTQLAEGRLHVDGNDTALGYQVSSPVMPIGESDRLEVRVPSTVASGRVCSGVLNADATRWLVPADAWREVLRFRGDATGGFRLVFANCNRAPRPGPSRFDIAPGSYVADAPDLYVDRLAALALGPRGPQASITSAGDLTYRAGIVARGAGVWTIAGRADSKYSFLLRSTARPLRTDQRVLVTGHVSRGGVTVGLLRNEQWAVSTNIRTPGDFRVVLAPPSRDSYEIVLANNLSDDLDTSLVVDRIDIYPAAVVPQ